MHGSGKNQANTPGRGAPEEACGEVVRPEAIPAVGSPAYGKGATVVSVSQLNKNEASYF
jgi:hypothetical protein